METTGTIGWVRKRMPGVRLALGLRVSDLGCMKGFGMSYKVQVCQVEGFWRLGYKLQDMRFRVST